MRIKTFLLFGCVGAFFLVSCSGRSTAYLETYSQAETLYKQKKYSDSLNKYNIVIAQEITGTPEVFDSYLKISYAYAFNKKFRDSYRTLNELKFLVKRVPDANERRSMNNKINLAKKDIMKLETRSAGKAMAKVEDAYNKAVSEYEKGNTQTAYKMFKKISGYKDAQDYLDEMDEKIEKIAENYFQEGFKLYADNKLKESIKKFDAALNLNPDHQNALDYKEKAEKKLEVLEKIK